tara:strand:+ start:2576 stop:3502 length:927 start_codon:yes stop_codon:yes gene_type:complete
MKLKKPNFWDYKYPNILAYLLLPVAFVVSKISSLRLKVANREIKIKTICVGNFYLGGTGKTSLSIEINKILNERKLKSCFIKKFYKNQNDEQELLKKNGKLFLSSSRKKALKDAENQNYEIAVLDDGLQDKTIDYDVSIVCFNNINWIGNGFTIPAGPLRESINNLKNYKNVFLNGNLENLENIKNQIFKINSEINIHLGKYEAKNIDEFNKNENYLIFSGIGNHQTFVSMIKNYGLNILKDLEFPDHYNYTAKDIDKILSHADDLKCKIITTEKDFLRLKNKNLNNINYIKSELKIIDKEKLIKAII